MPRWLLPAVALASLVVLDGTPASGAPVNSDLGAASYGGLCHPTGVAPALLDMLTLINPEWAPIVALASEPTGVDSAPVLVHGEVEEMHGDTSGDFPSTHLRADVVHVIRPDPADADRLATGNDDAAMQFEWEAGVYPAWAWAGAGDRLVGLGRWIFDCGHPGPTPGRCSVTMATPCVLDGECRSGESCVAPHFVYSSEIHPPYATAAIRRGRGAVLSSRPAAKAVRATRADIYVSNQAGGAGDRCVLTHQANDLDLLGVECFPLSQPIARLNAQDFSFDLPLPMPPPARRRVHWRVINQTTPGGTAARLRIRRRVRGADPHLAVTVRLTRRVRRTLPTGFAGTILAGWKKDSTPLVHVRLTLTDLVVHNALQPATPTVPRTCSTSDTPCMTAADCPSGEMCFGVGPVKSWRLQAAVNGEWQELVGLESVDTGDVLPQALVYDQYLPPDGTVHLEATGRSHECVDTMYGKSLATGLVELGFGKGVLCLASGARHPGDVDVIHPGPDFGAGNGGTVDREVTSSGGQGGHCSVNAALLCTVDPDCPSGESCVTTGGAFSLRYRIERLP